MVKDTLAQAVTRSIRNGLIDGTYLCMENFAYKAAWDRQGASVEHVIEASQRDAVIMQECVRAATRRRLERL